jgi:HAD superfamily hydrolase (TIGR01509 family)
MIKAIFLDFEGVVTDIGRVMHLNLLPKLKEYFTFEEMKQRYDLAKVGKLNFEEFTKGIPEEKRFIHMDKVKYRKGTREALKNLKKKYNLYIASNHLEVYFWMEVEKLKAKKYFRKIFPSNELKCAKPGKEFFKKVLKLSGEKSGESVFVDDAKRNLSTAKEIGFITVWVNNKDESDVRNKIEFTPDYEITDLRELENVIERINFKK